MRRIVQANRAGVFALGLIACAGDDRPVVGASRDGAPAVGDGAPDGAPLDAAEDAEEFLPARHRPFPTLSRSDGAVLEPVRLVMVYGPDEPLREPLGAFADAMPGSAWFREAGGPYGVRMSAGVVHLVGAEVPDRMDQAALRAYVRAAYERHPEAAPDGHTVYLFVFPPGTLFQPAGGVDDPCSALLGQHFALAREPWSGASSDGLGWAHRCPLAPGETELGALTVTIGHEFIEAATDPNPPHGYALPLGRTTLRGDEPPWALSAWSYFQEGPVENADLCEGSLWREGGHTYARNWSPAAAALGGDPCVPALREPYYSTTTPTEWVTVPAGTTAQIPVTGWSTGARADWYVTAKLQSQSATGFRATFADGTATAPVNNGRDVVLSVRAPTTPGAFAVFHLLSSPSAPQRSPAGGTSLAFPESGDQWHVQVVGVHTTCRNCARLASCGDDRCEPARNETCATCPDDCGACGEVCGAANFGVTCPGGATCPAGAICVAGGRCQCAAGSAAATCDGRPCPAGGCSGTDYWCTSCGRANGTILCETGFTCPSFSRCTATGCLCLDGYRPVSCAGVRCTGAATCPPDGWWCEPAA